MVSLRALPVAPTLAGVSTLILTYFYPPGNTPAARRIKYLAEKFSFRGPVRVVTATAGAPDLSFVEQTEVVSAPDVRALMGKLRPGAKKVTEKAVATTVKSRPLLKFLLPLRQAFPFLYLTDDGGPAYRRAAFRKACALIEKHGISTIFSSFRPWSDHLVARRLKREYPHLHWIADFRDLPADPIRTDVWWPALQTRWGRRVVRTADEMWCVSRGQKEQFSGWHPRIKVVRNALLALPPERTAPRSDRFTILYTGSLYPEQQSIEPLVESLRELLAHGTMSAENLALIYRGKDDGVFRRWAAGLPAECLDIQTSIAPAAAQKMQQNAQLLLMLNWSAPGYYGVLTAKLWDYLAAGRPVVALVNGPGDPELKEIILGADAGAVFGNEEQGALTAFLAQRYRAWAAGGGVSPHRPNRAALEQYL